MPVPAALLTQFTFALIAYSLVAAWYVVPALASRPLRIILPPLILPHLVRPVSMWLLVPDYIVRSTIPMNFAEGTAYGDLVAATLALIATLMIRREAKGAIVMVWIFNVWGIFDALRNCLMGLSTKAPLHMNTAVLIPAYGVPLLLVSHVLIFKVLLDHRKLSRAGTH